MMYQECQIDVRLTLSVDARLTRGAILDAVRAMLRGQLERQAYAEGAPINEVHALALVGTLKEEAQIYGNL